jgi:prefoldin subunit 5
MAFEPDDSGRPRLDWPEHDLVPASRRDTRQPELPEPEPEPPETEEAPSASVLFTVASRLEGLKTSLNNVSARLESLARSEEQFREFTTGRLGEHAEQISQAMREISGELATRAKTQDKALGDIKTGVDEGSRGGRDTTEAVAQLRQRSEEMGQSLEVLTGHVQAVAEDLPTLRAELIDFIARADARDEELAAEVTKLIEEVRVLRRRTPVRAASSAAARRPVRRAEPGPEPAEAYDYEEEAEEEKPAPKRRTSRARRNA